MDSDLIQLDLCKYLGRPFEKGGRGPTTYDCYGLCLAVYKELGLYLPDINTAEEIERNYATADSYVLLFNRLEEVRPYCLVAFSLLPNRVISHVGIVLPDTTKFIHCCNERRVSVEKFKNWSNKFAGYYEYIQDK